MSRGSGRGARSAPRSRARGVGPSPAEHEAEVGLRFDRLRHRFKAEVRPDDFRLRALCKRLGPLQGRLLLDLGCGKGRFAAHLAAAGAEVIGLDLSAAMLREAAGILRVRGSARRLPFAAETFDAVLAVEVFEHLADPGEVLREVRRVLRPGGAVAIVDKNAAALDARRPWLPSVAVKRLDERRGLWMYPRGGPVRERWFRPSGLRRQLERAGFAGAVVEHLLAPEEARWAVFRRVAGARLLTLWSAKVPGGARG